LEVHAKLHIPLGQQLAAPNPERLLGDALSAISTAPDWRAVLDEIPAPIYTTDPAGEVTYWNLACIDLAGRVPQLGQDRWCVTWRIYTTEGDFMPHDQCPMAETIKTKREVRGKVAIALRPDGSRVAFRPYPTPLFDRDGNFTGAINMLIDVSDEQVGALSDQAERCRRLADATYDRQVSDILGNMAEGYERTSQDLSKTRTISAATSPPSLGEQ
jgi:PAS domain S-box-containing protein